MNLKLIPMQELYQKFPELKESDITTIRQWMSKQPHLPELTDQEITNFLHARHFSIEAAKTLIENHLTVRTSVKDLFDARDVLADDFQMVKDVIVSIPLPKLTPEGYQVIFWKIIDSDMSKYNFKAVARLSTYPNECELLERGPTAGYVVLVDMNGFNLKHMLRFNPTILFQLMFFLQEAYQVRLKGFVFFNIVSFMDKFLALLKPMMKKELADNLKTYLTVDDLAEFMPLELLPSDYKGGKEDTIEKMWAKYLDYLTERREFFLEEGKTRRVNEKLRATKSPIEGQLFGLEGSFRKLDID